MLNIVPLLDEALEEVTSDARQLWQDGLISECACICTLVPESTPPIEKGMVLAEKFKRFREAMSRDGMRVGVLIQATIGHGWTPNAVAPFQRCVLPRNPNPYIFCALDGDFKEYIRRQVRALAALKPDFFMVDDDLRYISGRDGCYCPLHISRFNREHGTDWTAEALMEAVKTDFELASEYDRLQMESLDELAVVIREAIDAEAPGTPCSFCACSQDSRHALKITTTLTAPGDRPVVRLNNGHYLSGEMRNIPEWLLGTARQLKAFQPDCIVLDEPDTFPQNRWSTSAAMFHNHITCAIAEGCNGAKLWLYRNVKGEMDSGVEYRKILRRYIKFYKKLASLHIRWGGAATVIAKTPPMNFPVETREVPTLTWSTAVLGKMGIPFHFTTEPEGIVTLAGKDCDALDDLQLRELLDKQCVLLDGAAAIAVAGRGFADLLGTDAVPWEGVAVSQEVLPDGCMFRAPSECARLTPSGDTEILTSLFHQPSGCSNERIPLGAGATFHCNPGGGRVAVIASFLVPYSHLAFNMLCTNRKRMLLNIFERFGKLEWYIPGDHEIMMRAGKAEGGDILMLVNISLDDCAPVQLCSPEVNNITSILELTCDGEWSEVQWSRNGESLLIERELRPLRPVLLKIEKQVLYTEQSGQEFLFCPDCGTELFLFLNLTSVFREVLQDILDFAAFGLLEGLEGNDHGIL
ncbi:MAG: hypothetical protein J6S21_01125, partial [Victivallales bacterium]|nr:hypothetical protein [Victivallales bacterium]